MKTKNILAGCIAALTLAGAAQAATYHVYLTGSTAFRSATNNGLQALFGTPVAQSNAALASADAAMFIKTNYPLVGDTTYVKTTFLGAAGGIQSVAAGSEPVVNNRIKVPFYSDVAVGTLARPDALPVGPNREDKVPDNVDWDLWLGPAAYRPFKNNVYHSFAWRGWYDFGTGALGDMALHTVNMPFRALKLGFPTAVELEVASRVFPETFPLTSRIRFDFPERDGLPPCKFWWYDGNPNAKHGMFNQGSKKGSSGDFVTPLRPHAELTKEIVAQRGELPSSGCLIIGEKGKLFAGDDYGARFQVVLNDEKEYKSGDQHEACKAVPQTIPRSPGHDEEWFAAMRGGPAAYSNFGIAAYLTEIVLLGCVALRTGVGHKLEWDGPNMLATNEPKAAQFVKRQNRKGWEI